MSELRGAAVPPGAPAAVLLALAVAVGVVVGIVAIVWSADGPPESVGDLCYDVEQVTYLLHDGDLQDAVGIGAMLEGVIYPDTDQDFAREARHVVRAAVAAAGRTPESGDGADGTVEAVIEPYSEPPGNCRPGVVGTPGGAKTSIQHIGAADDGEHPSPNPPMSVLRHSNTALKGP